MQPRHKILIAEDGSGVRELLRDQLKAAGYEVYSSHNGREALDRVFSVRPDGMVLDINMPEIDGFGVLKYLQSQGLLMPILVLTAGHGSDDVKKAISLGARDYLTKPFTESQIRMRVARLMRLPFPTPKADFDQPLKL